jgi:GNAT superfamily N-acetyltransferase
MNTITIRPFAADEWRTWRELRIAALADSPDAFGTTLAQAQARTDETWASLLAQACSSPADLPLVAFVDGEPCGLMWANDEGGTVWLYQVWVAPHRRGCGVAQGLLRRAIDWARERGAAELRLDVTASMAPAYGLYKGMGFVEDGAPVPMENRSGLMEQAMRLPLGAIS